jgi:hypothetical protein
MRSHRLVHLLRVARGCGQEHLLVAHLHDTGASLGRVTQPHLQLLLVLLLVAKALFLVLLHRLTVVGLESRLVLVLVNVGTLVVKEPVVLRLCGLNHIVWWRLLRHEAVCKLIRVSKLRRTILIQVYVPFSWRRVNRH